MTTALDVTAPLYEDGPSLDDLQANGSPWAIRPELLDAYLLAADQIVRADWQEADRLLRSATTTISLRDSAADAAGQPISVVRIGQRDGSAVLERTIDDRTFDDPFRAWPDGILPAAWTMHYAVLLPRARRIADDAGAVARGADMVAALCTCSACGASDPSLATDVVERDGVQYRLCLDCHATYSLVLQERQANERIGKKTRREIVSAWHDGRPA